MEEKIYFKPESPGKKKDHTFLKLFFFLLFLLIIILIIIWLLKGSKTVSGQYPENVRNEALECISSEIDYPKLGSYNVEPKEKELKISAIFKGEDTLVSLSIKDLLTFYSNHDAIIAEARSHANFNLSLRGSGYGTEKFENKFSIVSEKLLVTLTGKASEIDEYSKEYFSIKSEKIPTTISEYKQNYEAQGFTCKASNEK